jgi:hypothetical protein
MRRRLLGWTAPGIVLLLVLGLLGTAGCSSESCGGQCGPPFQLQVIFRPGTPNVAAVAAMLKCRGDSVVRIGQVRRYTDLGEPKGSLVATVFTRSMQGRGLGRVLNCLNKSPAVIGASFPD